MLLYVGLVNTLETNLYNTSLVPMFLYLGFVNTLEMNLYNTSLIQMFLYLCFVNTLETKLYNTSIIPMFLCVGFVNTLKTNLYNTSLIPMFLYVGFVNMLVTNLYNTSIIPMFLYVGFVNTLEMNLYNTSLIPMSFKLRVPGDGTGENICNMSHYDSTVTENYVTVPPNVPHPNVFVEFEIIPSYGVLEPKSSTQVKVTLCSNTIRMYDLCLVVDVDGVGLEVLSLPISARYQ